MNKYINLFKERFIIAFKEGLEYKTNLYFLLIFNLIVIGKYFLTLNIMKTILGENFTWTNLDFIIFPILCVFAGMIIYDFSIKNFHNKLQNGELNLGLIRPINPFLYQLQSNIEGTGIYSNIIFIIIISVFSFYYSYFNLIGILFFCIGIIYYIIFTNFIESCNFFIKDNFVANTSKKMDRYNRTFTPKSFENANFEWLFLILPTAIYGYFTIEINKGHYIKLLEYQYLFLFMFIFMIIGTYFLWKFGLKKYEGYN